MRMIPEFSELKRRLSRRDRERRSERTKLSHRGFRRKFRNNRGCKRNYRLGKNRSRKRPGRSSRRNKKFKKEIRKFSPNLDQFFRSDL